MSVKVQAFRFATSSGPPKFNLKRTFSGFQREFQVFFHLWQEGVFVGSTMVVEPDSSEDTGLAEA